MGLGSSLVSAAVAPTDHLVLASRSGLRTALRIAAGAAATAGMGLTGWRVTNEHKTLREAAMNAQVLAPLAAAAALGGLSLLVRPISADIIRRGVASGEDAIAAAAAVQRSAGVVREANGTFAVVDLSHHWDLDRTALKSLRIGDGSVKFSALVTQDGDLLRPISSSMTGYRVTGPAIAPLQLSALRSSDPAAIERAMLGRQVGTDAEHRRLIAGAMVGSRQGYASAADAARGVQGIGAVGSEHLLAHAGDRWFAFSLYGPMRYDTVARGSTAGALDRIMIQSGKATYSATAPRTDFSFAERVLGFTTDEPIGRQLYLRGKEGSPVLYVGTHNTLESALGAAQRLGYKDGAESVGYGVVAGTTSKGNFHVYKLGSSANTWWEDELGAVQAVQYHDVERRTVTDASGKYLEHQERMSLWQMERDGSSPLVRDGNWRTVSREPAPSPGSSAR